jgi:hypothetical protein
MLSYVLEDKHAIHETTVYYVMRRKIWGKAKGMFSALPLTSLPYVSSPHSPPNPLSHRAGDPRLQIPYG